MKNTEKNIQKITDEISRVKEEIARDLADEPYLMKPSRVEQILDIKPSPRKRLMKEGELKFAKAGGGKQATVRILKSSVVECLAQWRINAITDYEDPPASRQAAPTKTKARKPSRTPRPKYLRQKAKPLILEALEDGGIHSWSEVLAYVKSAIRVAKITVELARAELKKDGLIALVKHDRKGREKYKVSHGWYIPETEPLEIHLPETKEQAPGSAVTIETTDEGDSVSSGEINFAFDEDKGRWTTTAPAKPQKKRAKKQRVTPGGNWKENIEKNYPMFLSMTQFKEITGYSRATGYRMVAEGELSSKRIEITKNGRPSVRIARNDLIALMSKWMETPERKEKPATQVKAKDSFLTTATADMLNSVTAPPSGVHTTASGSVPVWARYQDGADAALAFPSEHTTPASIPNNARWAKLKFTQDEMTQQNVNFTKRINRLREELKSKQDYINKYIEKNWFQKLIYRKGPKPEPLSFDMTISTESDRDASLRGTEEVLVGTWGHEPKKDNKAVGYARGVWTALKGKK